MNVTARIRFVLAAAVLSVIYFYLLVYLLGWMSAYERPGWWLGFFPTRLSGVLGWLILLHTASVLFAAFPVAVAALAIARKNAVQLGLLAAGLATVADILPVFSSTVGPLIWKSHPVFFVTDHVKLIIAVPLLVWVLGRATSNNSSSDPGPHQPRYAK